MIVQPSRGMKAVYRADSRPLRVLMCRIISLNCILQMGLEKGIDFRGNGGEANQSRSSL